VLLVLNPDKREWKNQEIGIAFAFKIPIIPIYDKESNENSNDENSKGLTKFLVPLNIERDENNKIVNLEAKIRNTIEEDSRKEIDMVNCIFAPRHFQRTEQMVNHFDAVSRFINRYYGKFKEESDNAPIRQRGGYSSFNIPDVSPDIEEDVWRDREGKSTKEKGHREKQLEEREVFDTFSEKNATTIIINPNSYFNLGKKVQKVRLETLAKALKKNKEIKLLLDDEIDLEYNLTIVGDFFLAETLRSSEKEGYKQTIFTTCAPYIRKRIEIFDERAYSLESNHVVNKNAAVTKEKLNNFIKICEDMPIVKFSLRGDETLDDKKIVLARYRLIRHLVNV
jgi:hypothetical protein